MIEESLSAGGRQVVTVSSDSWLVWLYARVGLAIAASMSLVALVLATIRGISWDKAAEVMFVSLGPLVGLTVFSLVYWRSSAHTTYTCDGVRLRVVRRSKVLFDEPVGRIRSLGIYPKLGLGELFFSTPFPSLPVLRIGLVGNPYDEIWTAECCIWGQSGASAAAAALAAACGGSVEVVE